MTTTTDPRFETLLEFLRDNRGFDFTGYKRSTLVRRVEKRMAEVEVEDFGAYVAFLEAHPGEFTALFNTILINVTGFWRDPDAWETLVRDHVPAIVGGPDADWPVRVWSAACASGEETYTLAMVFAEALGPERFRERVKIYATDVDEEALAQARSATYSERAMEGLPAELRERYFEPVQGAYSFRTELRRQVIFGRHDLVRDAPISHLDLLVSRNALMYFNAETQARILTRFHFALKDGGVLFLGKAEMMRSHGDLFTPADLKARIFHKAARSTRRDRLLAMAHPARADGNERVMRQLRIREAALDVQASAQLVVDAGGVLVTASAQARSLFGLGPADMGRAVQDLTLSYRPLELRSRIDQVYADRRPMHLTNVDFPVHDGAMRTFDVYLVPLMDRDDTHLGVSVSFVDVSTVQQVRAQLLEANQELETAFEELQSTNEELETTNEELQSTIEELETTNEELQSSNEELETMNEELQSTNEELETINEEIQRRTGELNEINDYMTAILTSLRSAVVVLDRDSDIRVWSRKAEQLWGLRADEVLGEAFQNLDIGLPVERLKAPIRACVEGRSEYEEMTLDAVNRRGRPIQCQISCTPFAGSDRQIRGAVLVMHARGDGEGEIG
jgi:two-component system CheB/CheR fusion protein